jgi:hypothetical protein
MGRPPPEHCAIRKCEGSAAWVEMSPTTDLALCMEHYLMLQPNVRRHPEYDGDVIRWVVWDFNPEEDSK